MEAFKSCPCCRSSHIRDIGDFRWRWGECLDCYAQWNNSRADLVPQVPAGWRLVPVEPTEAMIAKGAHANSEWLNDNAPLGEYAYRGPAQSVYADMLAAAPEPPGEKT